MLGKTTHYSLYYVSVLAHLSWLSCIEIVCSRFVLISKIPSHLLGVFFSVKVS